MRDATFDSTNTGMRNTAKMPRNGFGFWGCDRLFCDPVLNQFLMEESLLYNKVQEDSGLVCSHCYQRILGKVYRIENDFFDTFCYSMRFSLGYETTRKRELETATSEPLEE